jgi:tripartite-type tricarboxylate transporter receptor subunit TctC
MLAASCVSGAAMAQQPEFPARSVKLVVANGPGSAPDLLARQVGNLVGRDWKQAIVVENKGAAGGVSAVDAVVKAQPDGYTLLVGGDSAITIMPNVQRNLPYDVKNDLVPVTKLGQSDFVLVANPRKGFKTLQDFVAYAKTHPGKINYASSGTGGAQHLAMEQFKQRAGFFATHIPYRGGPQGLQDVLAGQVDVMLIAIAPALTQIQSGKLTALAVSGLQRHACCPRCRPWPRVTRALRPVPGSVCSHPRARPLPWFRPLPRTRTRRSGTPSCARVCCSRASPPWVRANKCLPNRSGPKMCALPNWCAALA